MLMALTGCGKSNKQTLAGYLEEVSKKKSGQMDFSIQLKDVSKPTKSSNDVLDITENYFSGSSIEGKFYSDGSACKGETKLNILKYTIPFNFIGDQKKLYVKLDFFPPFNKAMVDLGGRRYDLKEDAEKYADVLGFIEQDDSVTKKELRQIEGVGNASIKLRKDVFKALKEVIDELPKDSIKQNGDVITANLNKKELLNFMKKVKDEIDHDKDIKSNPINQEMINDFDEHFKTFNCVIKCNPKENTVNNTITGVTKQDYKTTVEIKTKNKDYDQKIEMPSKNEIIDNDKLEKHLNKINH